MRAIALAALGLALSGCFSVPLSPPLSEAERSAIAVQPPPHFTMRIQCVKNPDPDSRGCRRTLERARSFLEQTGWLAQAAPGEPADLEVTVRATPRRPWWSELPQNGLLMTMSLVLPLFWEQPIGLPMTVRQRSTGRELLLDQEEGTIVMWGLAPLLNLLPDRGWPSEDKENVERLRLQLLPLLAQ